VTTNNTNERVLLEQWEVIIKEEMPEPHAENMVKHIVKLEPGSLFKDMAMWEHREMQRVMRFTDSDVILTAEEIEKYLHTLVYLRTLQVNSDSKIYPKYKFASKNLNIPVRIYQILLSLGEAVDRDYGLRFVPIMEINSEMFLTPEELRDMSDRMGVLIPEGYLVVETGLPNDITGELGFMACLVVHDQKVYSYRKDHPVYGFIAAFFKSELLEKAFVSDYKIYYGSVSDYEVMLSRIYRK